MAVTRLGDCIAVQGGCTKASWQTKQVNSMYLFHIESRTWTTVSDATAPTLHSHIGMSLSPPGQGLLPGEGQSLLVAGGVNDKGEDARVVSVYTPGLPWEGEGERWVTLDKGECPLSTRNSVHCMCNGTLHLFHWESNKTCTHTSCTVTQSEGEGAAVDWTSPLVCPFKCAAPSVLAVGRHILVIGGKTATHRSSVHALDTETMLWEDWGELSLESEDPIRVSAAQVTLVSPYSALILCKAGLYLLRLPPSLVSECLLDIGTPATLYCDRALLAYDAVTHALKSESDGGETLAAAILEGCTGDPLTSVATTLALCGSGMGPEGVRECLAGVEGILGDIEHQRHRAALALTHLLPTMIEREPSGDSPLLQYLLHSARTAGLGLYGLQTGVDTDWIRMLARGSVCLPDVYTDEWLHTIPAETVVTCLVVSCLTHAAATPLMRHFASTLCSKGPEGERERVGERDVLDMGTVWCSLARRLGGLRGTDLVADTLRALHTLPLSFSRVHFSAATATATPPLPPSLALFLEKALQTRLSLSPSEEALSGLGSYVYKREREWSTGPHSSSDATLQMVGAGVGRVSNFT
ncbi:hypothetical protein KIPB_002600 [Kipferlia bialata]|uniref:Uncharacterized protein n=1 Tax=Kipferlia bialata TaxID=797122 RepID=A0A9K3GGD8_9EUKA|nr:hypothetical protein KIPB_002600 [Kipferlia bialata]|eukprot:g2600.t1